VGFFVLFALSALNLVAALTVAVRARLRSRAETLVAITILWNGLVITPIYVLGLTRHLTAWSLAIAAPLTALLVLALAMRGCDPRVLADDVGRAFVDQLRLPVDALVLSWRARSLIFVGVLAGAVLLVYLAVSGYLAQPQPHWDPLWYHDTMVGLTIQNHGFQMVDLPDTLQKVNGYVRLGEMTQLWMVIFADRRLADLTNLLFAPSIAAGTYVLARRNAGQLIAIGWGVAVLVMPACAGLLHSTYVDPQYGALLLAATVFATVPSPRLRDGLLASLALALTIGSKGLALIPVPVVGAVGAFLLLRAHWRARRGAALAVVLAGAAAVLLVASTTYLRNYWAFHNPLWPDLRVDIDRLGIHWPGLGPWSDKSAHQGGMSVNLNEPLAKLLDQFYALPWSVKGMFFDQTIEYGIGMIWIAFPLGAFAFFACLITAAWRRLRRDGVDASANDASTSAPPLALALVLAALVFGSPALWSPRYHIGAAGVLAALIAWLTGRPPRDRLGEAAVAAVLVTSVMMFWWTPLPRWWYSPEQLVKLAHISPLEREVDHTLGAPTERITGVAREHELRAGSLLVFTDRYSGFPSLFWNRKFSNRVLYMRNGPDLLARAYDAGATWIFLNDHDPTATLARKPGSGWQEVPGRLNWINGGFTFRRVARTPAPIVPPAPPPPPLYYGPSPPAPAAGGKARGVHGLR
jgi:hypothetical protein